MKRARFAGLALVVCAAGCYDLDVLGTLFHGEDGDLPADGAAPPHDLLGASGDAKVHADATPMDDADVSLDAAQTFADGAVADLGPVCGPGLTRCAGDCIDLLTDSNHCGGCATRCQLPNATAGCANGACTLAGCNPGFADCNQKIGDGCEVDVQVDKLHCGQCGTVCGNGSVCSNGLCAAHCAMPLALCGMGCADLTTDPDNCNGCGKVCPQIFNGTRGCAGGVCGVATCTANFANCDNNPTNGCEANLFADFANCGGCGKPCAVANATPSCVAGVCGIKSCTPGFGDCNGNPIDGCESAFANDVDHCGGCGMACGAIANGVPGCANGACILKSCNPNFGDCDGNAQNGCETALGGDINHCGGCNSVCGARANAAAACVGGHCTLGACRAGWGDCDANPANGCETNINTSAANCGGCGMACPQFSDCAAGKCGAPVTWSTQPTNLTTHFTSVWGSGANDVYAVGEENVTSGIIAHRVNGAWTKQFSVDNTWSLYAVWGSGAGDIYAAGHDVVFHSTGNAMWSAEFQPGNFMYGLWGSSATDVWAAGENSDIEHTTGGTWTYSANNFVNPIKRLWGSGPKDVYCVGFSGEILHNSGGPNGTWVQQVSGTMNTLRAIWGSGPNDIYVVGDGPVILHSKGDGAWSPERDSDMNDLWGVWGSGPNDLYAVGGFGAIVHSSNRGADWVAQKSGTPNTLTDVWGSGPGDVFAVGYAGTVVHLP